MTDSDPMLLPDEVLPWNEKRILQAARELKDPLCAMDRDEGRGIGAAEPFVWNALQEEFGYDYYALKNGDNTLKTVKRHGGVENGGYEDRYYRTGIEGVLLVLGYSTRDSLVHLAPTNVSLIKFRNGVIPE